MLLPLYVLAIHQEKINPNDTLNTLKSSSVLKLNGKTSKTTTTTLINTGEVLYIKYDETTGTNTTTNQVNSQVLSISNTFNKPDRIKGVDGNALRTDGFSTWIDTPFSASFSSEMTVQTWIAIESWPQDNETISLTPSSIIHQANGFNIGIDSYGRWWFELGGQKATASGLFPMYKWVLVTGVISSNTMKLYLNGIEVGSTAFSGSINSTGNLRIGKAKSVVTQGIFQLNHMNASYDETKIYTSALTPTDILNEYNSKVGVLPVGLETVVVPETRFATDKHRPIFHGMPPANWTNEPHGMVKFNNKYHIFYQRTPNGPFKTQMHWGHMISDDMVFWKHDQDALWPTFDDNYDRKGIWSGDVVVEGSTAHAFYTSVNYSGDYDPGIGHASSSDANLTNWTKLGGLIKKSTVGVDDFRDPYLWKEGNDWHMIIGASIGGRGGLAHFTSSDLNNWGKIGNIQSGLNASGQIWEMPVMESIGNGKHVLIVNGIGGVNPVRAQYWIGTWNGTNFTPTQAQAKNLDIIHGHLSPAVARNSNGNPVGIGIVDERISSEGQLEKGWCHTYSLPREWYLMADGKTLGQRPEPAALGLREIGTQTVFNRTVNGTALFKATTSNSYELTTTISGNATKVGVNVCVGGGQSAKIYYQNGKIFIEKNGVGGFENNTYSGDYDVAAFGVPNKIQVFVDHSVIDVFINDACTFSNRLYPNDSAIGIEFVSEGGTSTFDGEYWELKKSVGYEAFAPAIPVTSLTMNDDGKIDEGKESGEEITVKVNNNTFAATLTPSNWTVTNLPSGVTYSLLRVNDTTVKLVLGGAGSYDNDITNLKVSISKDEFTNSETVLTDSVSVNSGVTFIAYKSPVLNLNFETGDLTGWNVISGVNNVDFKIVEGTTFWGGNYYNEGTFHFNSFLGTEFGGHGDAAISKIRSNPFILGGDGKIKLLVSGGGSNGDLNNNYVALIRKSDNQLITKVTGPGGETSWPNRPDWIFPSDPNKKYLSSYIEREMIGTPGVEYYIEVVDSNTGPWGFTGVDDIRIPLPDNNLSVIDKSKENDLGIKLFPIPTHDYLYIETETPYLLQLFSISGLKIFEKQMKNRYEKIDVSNFFSGIYFLKFSNKINSEVRKVVIK
ncbi:hypothetical protein FUMI01_19770 [Flavobacterium sp. UMI-01]|nr:hypothetical protein FUMI01_19770 [Flavobacterium sp. UMI-01]